MTLWNDEPLKPLQTFTVVDFSTHLSGPLLTRLLSQYGAEVLKIENRMGDPLRSDPILFDLLNQGKRSLCLNLAHTESVETVKKVISETDILVENFPEGVMDKWGLGYGDLSEINPDLLYVSIRHFTGSRSKMVGFEDNALAQSGCGKLIDAHHLDNLPLWNEIVGGALQTAVKLLAHLTNPSRRGMHLVSVLEENMRLLFLPRLYSDMTRRETNQRQSSFYDQGRPIVFGYYVCSDNEVLSFCPSDEIKWNEFCQAVQRPEWAKLPLASNIKQDLATLFAKFPVSHWMLLAEAKQLPLVKVISLDNYLLQDNSYEVQIRTEPLAWCGFQNNTDLKSSPQLGADTYYLLHKFGISKKVIAELFQRQVVYQATDEIQARKVAG